MVEIKQHSTVETLGFQVGHYHVVLSFLRSNQPCFIVILSYFLYSLIILFALSSSSPFSWVAWSGFGP